MNIPDGSFVSETTKPLPDVLSYYGHDFRGCIRLEKSENGRSSEGFIILEDGNVLASAFMALGITLYQMSALERMIAINDARIRIYSYSEEELVKAFYSYPDSVIGILPPREAPPSRAGTGAEAEAAPASGGVSYDLLLSTIIQLPGVIAAALVLDGLPIYEKGQHVDFEHIAVATEDMLRSGTKIATELQLGSAEQIILETPSHKAVIAPISDMFLCVLTAADANLGLVRLSINNAQTSMRDR